MSGKIPKKNLEIKEKDKIVESKSSEEKAIELKPKLDSSPTHETEEIKTDIKETKEIQKNIIKKKENAKEQLKILKESHEKQIEHAKKVASKKIEEINQKLDVEAMASSTKENVKITDEEKEKQMISTEDIIDNHRIELTPKEQKALVSKLRMLEFNNVQKRFHSDRTLILKMIILGMLLAFITTYFVNASGLFSLGVSGFSQGLSYTIETLVAPDGGSDFVQNISYWVIYGLINVPILYFTYKVFNSKFFVLTLAFIVSNIAFGFIIIEIPGFTNQQFILDIFGDEDVGRFIIGSIGGVLYGLVAGRALVLGGSTGGFDPVSRHFSRTKGYNIGKINMIFTGTIVVFFLTLNDFILNTSLDHTISELTAILFGSKMMATLMFIAITSMIIDYTFPTNETLSITIKTEFGETLSNQFNMENWTRDHTIHEIKLGKTKKSHYVISMMINSRELSDLIDFVQKTDSQSFITTQVVKNIYGGNFDRKEITKDEELMERKKYKSMIKHEHQLKKIKNITEKKENLRSKEINKK